jgi:hypothetical protein
VLIYENAVIGNFLFGLGVAYGFRWESTEMPPMCVNLLQQTPDDQRIGDTLLRTSAFVRILEFKRRENQSPKEVDKLKKLRLALGGNDDMASVSRRIHWYVESYEGSETRILPYLDFDGDDVTTTTLGPFIEKTATDIAQGSERELSGWCEEYLAVLMLCNGSGESGAGAFIVSLSTAGVIQFAAIERMIDLRLKPPEFKQSIASLEQARERELERLQEQRKMRQSGREISHGHSR